MHRFTLQARTRHVSFDGKADVYGQPTMEMANKVLTEVFGKQASEQLMVVNTETLEAEERS